MHLYLKYHHIAAIPLYLEIICAFKWEELDKLIEESAVLIFFQFVHMFQGLVMQPWCYCSPEYFLSGSVDSARVWSDYVVQINFNGQLDQDSIVMCSINCLYRCYT